MNLFFDTSALVKYFHIEEGTEQVTALIHDSDHELWILGLARIEFISALFKKYRSRVIDGEQLDLAIAGFEVEYTTFNVEPLSPSVTREAEELLKKYGKYEGLRTLDALHLGAFRLLADEGWVFVSADEVLCNTARLEGFRVINPCRKNESSN